MFVTYRTRGSAWRSKVGWPRSTRQRQGAAPKARGGSPARPSNGGGCNRSTNTRGVGEREREREVEKSATSGADPGRRARRERGALFEWQAMWPVGCRERERTHVAQWLCPVCVVAKGAALLCSWFGCPCLCWLLSRWSTVVSCCSVRLLCVLCVWPLLF